MLAKRFVAFTIPVVASIFAVVLSPMPSHANDREFVVAQNRDRVNPTNDPDVQREIDQKQEQERQRRIDECVSKEEANLSMAQRMEQGKRIRRMCTSRVPRVTSVRG